MCRPKQSEAAMIDLRYSLVIEATEEPDFFSFYSPDLEGFSGVGHSVKDCLYKAKWGMAEHVNLLEKMDLRSPVRVLFDLFPHPFAPPLHLLSA
jgi:predicted RNase H-like HicB family nuclease